MTEGQVERLHAACDACRARKLKCSGEFPQCSRCEREGIQCIYSPKKPMGRPRKRRRDEVEVAAQIQSTEPGASETVLPRTDSLPLGLLTPPAFTDFSPLDTGTDPTSISVLHDGPLITDIATQGHLNLLDLGLGPPIDPLLWNGQAASPNPDPLPDSNAEQPAGPCTCLSVAYLTQSELQAMFEFTFPAVVHSQRRAMNTASTIMHCKRCPTEISMSIQNTQSLSALMFAIAERFHKILKAIDTEAEELERTGARRSFRVGDNNPMLQHLHSGTEDCPLGFNIELTGKDWKNLAKMVVKTEVLGGGRSSNSLNALLDQFEQRQKKWHSDPETAEERADVFGDQSCCRNQDDATCVRMIDSVRAMIRNMKWD